GNRTPESKEYLRRLAEETRIAVYGRDVYIRGLIETTNICKNDCYYCGIRRSNASCSRYRLTLEDILEAAGEGYTLGFRTFVLQGGEDGWFTDERTTALIRELKHRHPDCAVTLSLGERSYESYRALREAGADRYLLRHETADEEHYAKLHPAELTLQNRMECLRNLKELGYQVGCGFMVGSPYQEVRHLAKDLKFIEEFSPAMCGIGPFITHKATPFASFPSGSFEDTIYLLSILRLIKPTLLLPATTALGTIHPKGREMGILAGANVVMPNLSPLSVRKKYELYEGKIATGEESAQSVRLLAERMESIGYKVVTARGDAKQ
ncbi:MAG: [Clostridia bacterium]|nr:[FeFe] hydrogenase H-cluster radical SAM maturase HydE [Clostridia bacterium]